MSLLNSLFSGVSGLKNHQTMMDVIGNNISNVNSIGFKGSRVTFSDTFNQFVRSGSDPTETSGGTNSFQVGLGMKVNSIDKDWNQGTFERTGIGTDLALQGDALFVLENNGEQQYSRAGNFMFDADGKLVNPQNGAIVQGKMATEEGVIPPGNNLENIVIEENLKLPAVATTEPSWGGNLDSTAAITRSEEFVQTGNLDSSTQDGDDSIVRENNIYDHNGNEYTLKTSYDKTANADEWELTYEILDSEGNNVDFSVDGGADVSSQTETITFDGDGNMQNPATYNIANSELGIDFDFDNTNVTQTNNNTTLSGAVDDNREPTIVNGTLSVYDSLGNPHTLTLKFTKTSDNNWNWNVSVPDSSGSLEESSGTMSFNADGSINTISPNPPTVKFNPVGGASSQNIKLDFGEGFSGITQTSSNSVVSALNQNGAASANLNDINIAQNGDVTGVFSNGKSRKLAKIMLAKFPNLNGLTSTGENMYSVSANSGEPLVSEPGEDTGTTIQSGALEQSNVELSEEFTRLIVAQRGFQANARVVTTSDNLLQEITNLVDKNPLH